MMSCTSGRLVPMMSLRDDSGLSLGTMPAAASSGRVSSKMRPLDKARMMPISMHPLDARTQLGELFLDAFVAAVEVVNPLDGSFTCRDESCQYEASRGPQVGRHHDGAIEPRHAAHQRSVAGDFDIGTQPAQFLHMHEAVFENGFGHAGDTAGHAIQ